MVVRVMARATERLRCAVCHDDASAPELARCRGCATYCHADCLAAAEGCPSLACPLGRPRPVRLRVRGPALGTDLRTLVRAVDLKELAGLARDLLVSVVKVTLLAALGLLLALLGLVTLIVALVALIRLTDG